MGMNTASVQRLYVAYFNRPADPVSLAVYEAMLPTDRVATQAELQAIADTYFSPSAEYQTNFAGSLTPRIVDQLYQNIFGRTAEPDGLIYWAGQLTDGSITVAELALQLSYSAQGTDAAVVDARIEAATTFTDSLWQLQLRALRLFGPLNRRGDGRQCDISAQISLRRIADRR